ncbi:hypothetical protein BC629DRAFT_1594837 [Irpex lacteus]|nr:hypothetical protein BC629DRAFT_1594837 [Irpex lacteus]
MINLNTAARLLLTALLSCSAVIATPTPQKSRDVIQLGRNPSFSAPAGAAYFLTNEPTGNYIVVAALKSDGTPTYVRAVSNRGTGAHGNSTGPDALYAQSTIKASATANLLAAVNPGSGTVSLFSIDPKDPTQIEPIGQPTSTIGEFPNSVAFNSKGTQACVLNAGGPINGVNCYKVDKSLGLVPLNNTYRPLNFPVVTPPTGPLDTLTQVLFNEDDSKLIAVAKGHPGAPGFFAIWDVNADGTLSENFTKLAPPTGGAVPFGVSLIPGSNALLATDPVVGAEVVDLSGVSSNTTGTLSSSSKSSLVNVTGQGAVCWSAHSTKTGNFYVTDIINAQVTEISVDKNLKGTIVKQYQRPAGSATIDDDVATLNGKEQANATEVGVLRLDGSGKGRDIGNFDLSHSAKAAGLKISPENLVGLTTFVTRK